MFKNKLSGLLLAACLWALPTAARGRQPQRIEMTYDEALSLARAQAPSLAAARAGAREAHSRVEAASVWRFNPQIQSAVGPRFGAAGTVLDWQIGAQQWLELGGQRKARVGAARAGAAAGDASSEDAQRRVLREVSLAFISSLYWARRVAIASENLEIARAVEQISTRRREVGEGDGLDAAASTLAVARALSDVDRAQASLVAAHGRLEALLGLDDAVDLVCTGDLRTLGIPIAEQAKPAERPDIRALQAQIDGADAEVALARAARTPNLAVGARYNREELDHRVQGTVTFEIPAFDRGQGRSAVARARRSRLEAELEASRSDAAVEAATAREVAAILSKAATRFEAIGVASLERSERLATAGYTAGDLSLGELMALRRELVSAKIDHADLLFEAAVARAELAASTGALR